jgi:membrane fusion protein (multidrug efflux system)
MKKLNLLPGIVLVSILTLSSASCGSGAKEKKSEVTEMKVKLEKLKKEKSSIDAEIRQLEADIAKADPNSAQTARKLVAFDTLRVADFQHYIELQGKIDAEGMAYVAPKGMGGVVKAVYVKAGQRVGKGQLILKLDDAVARQQVVMAQQSVSQLRTRLAQAQTVYERYKGLWEQNIGAEIQVINAKADVDALQSQLNAANAQVRLAQETANMSNVYAEMGGVIDMVNIKVGEFFSPQSAANPASGIRIVNNTQMKMVTEVPENYITRVKKGDKVEVVIPEAGKTYSSVISSVGASIDMTKRSFLAEAKLPSDNVIKPNLTATMKILDYEVKGTIAVPVNVVQSDEKGKYVYVVENTGGKLVARKRVVDVGETYNGLMEIKNGLKGGDVIIREGYQTVYEGQLVTAEIL